MGQEQTILVVDDEAAIREVIATVLEEEGYTVITAASGEAALAMLNECTPALIMLDMRMPVMDGWEFAEQLRLQCDHDVPLLVMTAAVDAVERADQVGAAATLSKPFDLDELLRLVASVVAPGGRRARVVA